MYDTHTEEYHRYCNFCLFVCSDTAHFIISKEICTRVKWHVTNTSSIDCNCMYWQQYLLLYWDKSLLGGLSLNLNILVLYCRSTHRNITSNADQVPVKTLSRLVKIQYSTGEYYKFVPLVLQKHEQKSANLSHFLLHSPQYPRTIKKDVCKSSVVWDVCKTSLNWRGNIVFRCKHFAAM